MFRQSVGLKTHIIVHQMKYYKLVFGTTLQTQKRQCYFSEVLGLHVIIYVM